MTSNFYLIIANILTTAAFFIHTFVGDREINLLKPTQRGNFNLLEKWTVARCGWHWISMDLFFSSVLLGIINFSDWLPQEQFTLQVLAVYFFGYGLIWIWIIFLSQKFPKNYLKLGQWGLLFAISGLIYLGSKTTQDLAITTDIHLQKIVDNYIQTYQKRADFNKFLSFYSDSILLEDMVGGYRMEGKNAFAEFFDWPNPNFQKLEEETLMITDKIIDNQQAVLKGYFTPFSWNDQKVEAMQFTTVLTFDEANKIEHQVDWINYPNNLIDYAKRVNSNEWIKER